MTTIAFLILAHKNPAQIARLCRILTGEGDSVFVHIDKAADLSGFTAALAGMPRVHLYHAITVCWAGYSMVRATNLLIEEARSKGDFDYFHLLSGQCFPIKPVAWLKAKLVEERGNYFAYYPMPRMSWAKNMERVDRHHFEVKGAPDWKLNLLRRIARRLPKRNVVKGLGVWPHAGSQWWCLSRDAVEFIVQYRKKYPSFDRYMRTVGGPDEIYYQSILSASHYPDERQGPLFWTQFDPTTNHPYIWKLEDYDRLMALPHFVVRKVDTDIDDRLVAKLEEAVSRRSATAAD